MSLTTPDEIRTLQRKLYGKAKPQIRRAMLGQIDALGDPCTEYDRQR